MGHLRRIELTLRLQAVADWVPNGARLADVGTDHAYLPAWLVQNGRIAAAIASDLREGPLKKAGETCRRFGVESIDLRLCNGLAGISPEEADTIVIAGMGGENIAAILEAAPWTADGKHTLILQPMSRVEVLRSFLADHGYAIRREAVIPERDTLYPLMLVTAGKMTLSPGQIYGGAELLHDPMGDRYLIHRILQYQGAVAGCNRSSAPGPEIQRQADQLREIITALLEMREEWRRANCP